MKFGATQKKKIPNLEMAIFNVVAGDLLEITPPEN